MNMMASKMILEPSKIWKLMVNKGLSWRSLAAAAGISQRITYKVSHGMAIYPITAKKIADCLGVQVTDLAAEGVPMN